MGIPGESCAQLVVKFAVLFPHLDERQRRLLMGAEARILGHGGVRVVAQAAGTSETTVRKGGDELEAGEAPLGRVRRRGGGRKKAADVDPGLRPALLALVEPDPVISVDTKKKELVGPFSNPGRQWRPKGSPEQVSTHDFPDRQLGKAVRYGIYDVVANTGWVNVGIDHDTAAFAAGVDAPLVERGRTIRLPAGAPAAGDRRRRRIQRLPAAGLEGPAGRARRGDRPGDHRVPRAARHLQVEPD